MVIDNPYYTEGLSRGAAQGLQIFEALEGRKERRLDRERQERLDRAKEDEQREISRLRDVQIRQAESALKKAEDDAAVLGTVEERRERAQEDRDAQKKERDARLANLSLQRRNYKLQADKYAKELETEEERDRFYKVASAVQIYSSAPPQARRIISKLGAVAAGQLPISQISQEDLDEALPYLLGPEMEDRVDKEYVNVETLKKRGYDELPKNATGKVVVEDVGNPYLVMDPESQLFTVFTDQIVRGKTKDGRDFRVTLKRAPATIDAKEDGEPAFFTLNDLSKRALEMTGVGAAYRQLQEANVPLDQIPFWIASESARLNAPVPATRETMLPVIPKPITPTAKDIISGVEGGVIGEGEGRALLGLQPSQTQTDVDLSQWRIIE